MATRNSDFIDIKGLLDTYRSKWYYFIISVILCCGLATIYILAMQPKYAVQANMVISTDAAADPTRAANPIDMVFGSDGYVEDEIFVVSSHTVYADVARTLGINVEYLRHDGLKDILEYPSHGIEVTAPAAVVDTLTAGMRFTVSVDKSGTKASVKAKYMKRNVVDAEGLALPATVDTPIGAVTIATTATYPAGHATTYTVNLSGYGAAAEKLAENVHIEIASKKSNVIALSMRTTNTKYGEAILNEIIAKYNERGIMQKNNRGRLTDTFLDSRISLLANDLDNIELQILNYKKSKNIYDIESTTKYEAEKKGKLEENLLGAETRLELLRMTRDFVLDDNNRHDQIPILANDGSVQGIVQNLNQMNLSRMDLTESAREDNDALRRLDQRIDIARKNLLGMLDDVIGKQTVTVGEIRREIDSASGSLKQLPQVERDIRQLYRQQGVQQSLYMYLLQKREENSMLMANAIPKGEIIDRAYTLSKPLGMGKKMVLALAFLFGLILPPVFIYLRRTFNTRFETRHDVERLTDVPILGEMCMDRSGNTMVVSADSTESSAELFRLMRSNLMFILNGGDDKVVLVTSSVAGEGKSFISINLASSLSLLGKRVLLVGMDIRNPRLAQYLDINPRYGLTGYLSSNDISIDDMITPLPGTPGLDVIVAGPVPPNPAELLLSPRIDQLFARLRQMYDYIVVDTAPIGQVSDTFTLNRIADASIYVCRANYTTVSDLEVLNDIYEQSRLKKLSLVINGTAAQKSYGYSKSGR